MMRLSDMDLVAISVTAGVVALTIYTLYRSMLDARELRKIVNVYEHNVGSRATFSRIKKPPKGMHYVWGISQIDEKIEPPRKIEIALGFLLGYKNQESIIGDLAELYERKRVKFGRRTADIWYCRQAIGTVVALAFSRLSKWGWLAFMLDFIHRWKR